MELTGQGEPLIPIKLCKVKDKVLRETICLKELKKAKCVSDYSPLVARNLLINETLNRVKLNLMHKSTPNDTQYKLSGLLSTSKVSETSSEHGGLSDETFVRKEQKTQKCLTQLPEMRKSDKSDDSILKHLVKVPCVKIPWEMMEKRLKAGQEQIKLEEKTEDKCPQIKRTRTKAVGVKSYEVEYKKCSKPKTYESKEIRKYIRSRRSKELIERREEVERRNVGKIIREERLNELLRRVDEVRNRVGLIKMNKEKEEEARVGNKLIEEVNKGVFEGMKSLSDSEMKVLLEEFEGIVVEVCRDFFTGDLKGDSRTVATKDEKVGTHEEWKPERLARQLRDKHKEKECLKDKCVQTIEWKEEGRVGTLGVEQKILEKVGDDLVTFKSSAIEDDDRRSEGKRVEAKDPPRTFQKYEGRSKGDFKFTLEGLEMKYKNEKKLLKCLRTAVEFQKTPGDASVGDIYRSVELGVSEALRGLALHKTQSIMNPYNLSFNT